MRKRLPSHDRRFRFAPKVLPSLIVLSSLILLVALGMWQLHRASDKAKLLEVYTEASRRDPIRLGADESTVVSPAFKPYQRLLFNGQLLNNKQFLLDNQFDDHHYGFHVISPVEIEGIKKWVLIDRGWVPGDPSRRHYPGLKPLLKAAVWEGRMVFPSHHFMLKQVEDNPHQWPRVIQDVDFDKMQAWLGHAVYPFLVQLDEHNPNGYVRRWQVTIMLPQQHIAYAIQWFLLAGALVIVACILYFTRKPRDLF